MQILARGVDRLHLGPWVLLVEDILRLELLITRALVVNSLAFVREHVLVVLDLRDLLLL